MVGLRKRTRPLVVVLWCMGGGGFRRHVWVNDRRHRYCCERFARKKRKTNRNENEIGFVFAIANFVVLIGNRSGIRSGAGGASGFCPEHGNLQCSAVASLNVELKKI